MAEWTEWGRVALVHVPVALSSCPRCAALVPDWADARLCHDRWHAEVLLNDGSGDA